MRAGDCIRTLIKKGELYGIDLGGDVIPLPKEKTAREGYLLERIRDTKAAGHRVIAVGTTSCRTLEAVAWLIWLPSSTCMV